MADKFQTGICNCNILMFPNEINNKHIFNSIIEQDSGLYIVQYQLKTYTGLLGVLPINSEYKLNQQLWFESITAFRNYLHNYGFERVCLINVKAIKIEYSNVRDIPKGFYDLKIHSMLNTGGTNTMNHRSDENTKEKMERSDDCNKSCIFKDDDNGKCIFETCVQEELPPFQSDSCTIKCIICGDKASVDCMSLLTDHRICNDCRGKLLKWVKNCDTVLEHVKSHASHG